MFFNKAVYQFKLKYPKNSENSQISSNLTKLSNPNINSNTPETFEENSKSIPLSQDFSEFKKSNVIENLSCILEDKNENRNTNSNPNPNEYHIPNVNLVQTGNIIKEAKDIEENDKKSLAVKYEKEKDENVKESKTVLKNKSEKSKQNMTENQIESTYKKIEIF